MQGGRGYDDEEHHSRNDNSNNSTSVVFERSVLPRRITPN
jgi:hypothetical protein